MSLARHSSPMRSDPGVFLVVDVFGIVRSVIEQYLHAVRSGFLQTAYRPMVQQVAEAAGAGLVIAGLLVGQQQAGILGAPL